MRADTVSSSELGREEIKVRRGQQFHDCSKERGIKPLLGTGDGISIPQRGIKTAFERERKTQQKRRKNKV